MSLTARDGSRLEGSARRGEAFVPYVPRLVIDWLANDADRRARSVDGSVAFIDISGFTALSERLAAAGKVGAELLADTIGSCFTDLLTVAYAHGGRLLKFGGDALLLFFDGEEHPTRACRSAALMRAKLREIGDLRVGGRRVQLKMSVGVHSGTFHLFLVGDAHRELIIAGPTISATVALEGAADAGEILISPETATALRGDVLGDAKGPGLLLRRTPASTGSTSAWAAAKVPEHVDLTDALPVALREPLLAGIDPEHRRTTVAFVHFDGTDSLVERSGIDEAAAQIEQLVAVIEQAAERNGTTFLATDIDHDGGKVILVAGAPVSRGDDERRMLSTLREIVDAATAIPVRIGVNRGPVFAGDIGPRYRRTYTVMGDTVNLAARLMARAEPGEILATREVLDRSETRFEATELAPFMVKGKSAPVQAYAVGSFTAAPARGATGSDEGQSPFVGRRVECQKLEDALAGARQGRGRAIEIVGEQGIGKSRLAYELCASAPDVATVTFRCDPYEAATPFAALRERVRELLGITALRQDPLGNEQLRVGMSAIDPALVVWLPLVGAVVDVAAEPTSESASLDPSFRAARLASVMTTMLEHLLSAPTILIFEDTQWMDEASADLVRRLSIEAANHPWLLVTTGREPDETEPVSGVDRIVLDRLAPDEAAELVRRVARDLPISLHDLDILANRSGGNPLFLVELVAAAQDADDVSSLPDSVDALVIATIDRLDSADRNVLRRASVLGRTFPLTLLTAVLDDVPDRDDAVWHRLRPHLRVESSNEVAFEHSLVRDCAYEALPFKLRRDLHARAGDAIRSAAGDHWADHAELLSLHFFSAQRYDEALPHSRLAAERAAAVFADLDAAELYQRAVTSAAHVDDVAPVEIGVLQEALGDVRYRSGAYRGAGDAYVAARRALRGDVVAESRLLLKLAWTKGWLGRYSQALGSITRGLSTLGGADTPDALSQRAQLQGWYAQFCQERGNHRRAIRWCRSAIVTAEAAGDIEALAHAVKVLGWAEMELGRTDSDESLRRALVLYVELDDLPGQASVLNMLGGHAYWRGRWDEALERYEQARELNLRTGHAVLAAFCATNIGEIALDRGEVAKAEDLFRDALRTWDVAGDRPGAAFARSLLGRVAMRIGDYDGALGALEEARTEFELIGADGAGVEVTARIAECLLASGRSQQALELAEVTLERAGALSAASAEDPLLHRVRGTAARLLGDLDTAEAALLASLEAGRARDATHEIALTLAALADLTTVFDEAAAAQMRTESTTILDQLGITLGS